MIGSNCIEAKRQHLRFSTKYCPRCGSSMKREMIDVNLLESTCERTDCGYSVRDRSGSIAEANAALAEADERYGRVVVTRRAS